VTPAQIPSTPTSTPTISWFHNAACTEVAQHVGGNDQPCGQNHVHPLLPFLEGDEGRRRRHGDDHADRVRVPRWLRVSGVTEQPRRDQQPNAKHEVGGVLPLIVQFLCYVCHVDIPSLRWMRVARASHLFHVC